MGSVTRALLLAENTILNAVVRNFEVTQLVSPLRVAPLQVPQWRPPSLTCPASLRKAPANERIVGPSSLPYARNLQNMHEKSLPPAGARRRMELEYQDSDRTQRARLQGRGPDTGGRYVRPHSGVAVTECTVVVESRDGQLERSSSLTGSATGQSRSRWQWTT